MYASIALAILLTVTLPFARIVSTARHVTATAPALTRPQVVENGTDLVLYHFMGNIARPVAFTPDGTSWSVLPHGLLKIAPDGTNTLLGGYRTIAGGDQNIVYSNGFLWFTVYHGIVRIRPDGTESRFYQFTETLDGFHFAGNLNAGADGPYFTAISYQGGSHGSTIGRIDSSFKLTLFQVPSATGFTPSSPLVAAPDGHEYFIGSQSRYDAKRSLYSTLTSLFRLETDGTQTLLGSSSVCAFPKKAVVALGALYFIGTQYDATNKALGSAICRATLSGKIAQIAPTQPGHFGPGLTADASGNLWTTGLFGSGLYSYAVATKQLAGPFEPSFLNATYPYLYTGPDQNIWLFGNYATNQVFYGAYVRHVQSFIPTSVSLSAGDPSINFYVNEPLRSGPYTAFSLDAAVATVTPTSSLVGRFNVRKVAAGTTSIAVKDAFGNVSYEPVTSN